MNETKKLTSLNEGARIIYVKTYPGELFAWDCRVRAVRPKTVELENWAEGFMVGGPRLDPTAGGNHFFPYSGSLMVRLEGVEARLKALKAEARLLIEETLA